MGSSKLSTPPQPPILGPAQPKCQSDDLTSTAWGLTKAACAVDKGR